MIVQNVVAAIAWAGIGLVAAGFIHVIVQAGKPADADATSQSARTARTLQKWLFVALFLVFIGGSWATLANFPIAPQHAELQIKQVVDVVGRQWSWQITPATIQADSPVEFRVTSADVNHGFAVYAPNGRIKTQTQAMPGYINRLVYTFHEPGTYTVQCLEYCGLGHAPMKSTFQVVAAQGE